MADDVAPTPKINLFAALVGNDPHPFNLNNIDVTEGKRLLAALPPEARASAEASVDRFYMKVQRPLAEDLPESLREPGALEALLAQAASVSGSNLEDIQANLSNLLKQHYKAPDKKSRGMLNFLTGYVGKALGKASDAAATGLEFSGNVAEETVDMVMWSPRALANAILSSDEASVSVAQKPSRDQALALAAVRAAVIYGYTKSPDAPAATKAGEPTTADEIVVGTAHTASTLWNSEWMIVVRAFLNALGSMLVGKKFDLAKAQAEIEQKIAEGGQKTYDQRLAEHMEGKVADRTQNPVKLSLNDIGTVAGLNTKPYYELMANGGYFVDFDGNVLSVDKGGDNVVPLQFKGKPVTGNAVDEARQDDVDRSIGTHGKLVTAVSAVAASRVAVGAAAGAAQRLTLTPVRDLAKTHAAAAAKVGNLEARLEKAREGKTMLQGGGNLEELEAAKGKALKKLAEAETALAKRGVYNPTPTGEGGHALVGAERNAALEQQRLAHLKEGGVGSKIAAWFSESAMKERNTIRNPLRWPGAIGRISGRVVGEGAAIVRSAVAGVYNATSAGLHDAATSAKEMVEGAKNAVATMQARVAAKSTAVVDHYAAAAHATADTTGVNPKWKTSLGAAEPAASQAAAQTAEAAAKSAGRVASGRAKLLAALAALFGAGVATTASANEGKDKDSKSFTSRAVDLAGELVGKPDFEKGDNVRGFAALLSWSKFFLNATGVVDTTRQIAAMNAVAAERVAELASLMAKQTKPVGNVYLDRVAALIEMQNRGVKVVALAPYGGLNPLFPTDNMGEIAHAGEAFVPPQIGMEAPIPREISLSIREAIEMNLRLYVVKGGDLPQAQALLAKADPSGKLHADPKLVAEAVAATVRAQQAAKAATGNRGVVFAVSDAKSEAALPVYGTPSTSELAAIGAVPMMGA